MVLMILGGALLEKQFEFFYSNMVWTGQLVMSGGNNQSSYKCRSVWMLHLVNITRKIWECMSAISKFVSDDTCGLSGNSCSTNIY
ncbi:hypothetical protein R6Q59_025019 [Mikania micrantha]